MEKNEMKNIILLKNLPSNLVEEAIVIVKQNKTAKAIEYIDNKENEIKENETKDKNYIIREAESVISNYINTIQSKEKTKEILSTNKRYKMLKIYSIFITISLILFSIFH